MATGGPGPESDEEDAGALFRRAVGQVRRLPEGEAAPAAPRPRPLPRMRDADEARALRESRQPDPGSLDAAEPLRYRRAEVSEKVLKKLRRAEFRIDDEIDLHGLELAAAEALLREFLRDAAGDRDACVRIVHGKGRHSPDGSPLKTAVDAWLRRRADVLAFASPPPALGGSGAVLVLLRSRG
jgi:DNA-nicking Smr family endonuclease